MQMTNEQLAKYHNNMKEIRNNSFESNKRNMIFRQVKMSKHECHKTTSKFKTNTMPKFNLLIR